MKPLSRFVNEIEELTGTLAHYGEDSVDLIYEKSKQDKKSKDVELLINKGWNVDAKRNRVRVKLQKHLLPQSNVRYTKN